MVIRPWGYGIWELMQAELDRRIKEAGAENAYFPLFIPESFLKLEAEHVEGFAPELAVVTHGGGKELEEPLVVRPTSETVINHFFSKWVQSHRDLPLLINQWANVVRWELRPRLFLRTTEFLWQEGHTAHATEDDAHAYALRILDEVYRSTMVDVLSMPVLTGHKTARERFAGAIQHVDERGDDGRRQGPADGDQPRAGAELRPALRHHLRHHRRARTSTCGRPRGASRPASSGRLVMGHGDDFGLRLPPALAPAQVVVLVVKDSPEVGAAAEALVAELTAAGHRVRLDARTDTSFGRRSVAWELKGVPVRVEVGPRDLAEGNVTVVTRHTREKQNVARGRRRRHGGRHPAGGRARRSWRRPRRPATPGRWMPRHSRRPPRRPPSASPGSVSERSAPTGRTAWPRRRSPSGACNGPTARWPSPGTPRTISWRSWPGPISAEIAIIPSAVHF